MIHTDHELQDVIISHSTREASYCRRGWTKHSVKASLWSLGASRESSSSTSSANSSSNTTTSIIGRYVQSKCMLTLGKQLKPHPAFESAIATALAIPDESERIAELTGAFERFGHVYVSSVEMGGMKFVSSTKELSTEVCTWRTLA